MIRSLLALLATSVLVAGCSTVPAGAARSLAQLGIDHYNGTWLEIGRRPMWLTDGCVAGYTTYGPGKTPDTVAVEDGCHDKTPAGKLKAVRGTGTLLDAGTTNARLRVRYPFFITFNYWVLYEAPDHGWFISASPNMKNLWIYTRDVPTDAQKAEMVAKAQALGYDTSKLEFPPQR